MRRRVLLWMLAAGAVAMIARPLQRTASDIEEIIEDMAREINDAAVALLREFEGMVLKPYHDVRGIMTIGIGHRIRPEEKFDTITEDQAHEILKRDIASTAVCVEKWVNQDLNDNQFGALVCFAFNIGVTNFYKSHVLGAVQAGDFKSVPGLMLAWDHADGKEVAGLKRRRIAEGNLWSTP